MRVTSITFKLLAVIVVAFFVMTVGIVVLSNEQFKQILDETQESVYAERVDVIIDVLNRHNERLNKTGLVAAYIDDFQQSAVTLLRKNYYKQPPALVYPFIVHTNGMVIMHPVLPANDLSLKDSLIATKMRSSEKGSFTSVYLGQEKWYVYQHFDAWNWVVGYTIPLDIKYADARIFYKSLIAIIGGVTLCVLILLAMVLTRFIKPIITLTEASKQISGGNLEYQVDLGGTDELGILSHSFDNMRKAIRDQIIDLSTEISERRRAEEELKQLRNYLTNMIDSMPSILIGVDTKGLITQWNREASVKTGLSVKATLGQPFDKVMPRLSGDLERVRHAIENRQELRIPKRRRQEGDKIVYEDVTIYPLVTNGANDAVIRIDDVTELVQFEEIMVQGEKMLSVGGLAAGMAHEINNPMAAMIQTADVMANRLGKDTAIQANQRAAKSAGTTMEAIERYMEARGIPRMINAIVSSGRRVAEIVDNMLSFARKTETIDSPNSIEMLIEKSLELAATDYDLKKGYDFKRIKIEREYADNLPDVPCEGTMIQQVLLNVLTNGAQAMQAGGIKKPGFVLRTHVLKESSMVCMEIEDNGPGIDEEIRKRVFEPFFTTKAVGVGTGLGLSVSYFIVTETHGGKMAVESGQGGGANFIICLPVKRREVEHVSQA